jgi:hypothetical protein
MYLARRILIVVAAGLIFLAAFFVLPSLRRFAAQKKYPVGILMEQATSQLRPPYYISTNSEDTRLSWRYLVVARKDGLVMQFDRDGKLISVVLYTDYK